MRPPGPVLASILLGGSPLAAQAVRGTLVAAPGPQEIAKRDRARVVGAVWTNPGES